MATIRIINSSGQVIRSFNNAEISFAGSMACILSDNEETYVDVLNYIINVIKDGVR